MANSGKCIAIYRDKVKFIFILSLLGCAIIQFLLTQYFTIFEGQAHLGLDASWEYMKVIMAAKHGGLYPKEFMHETTQPEMERILFVLPFYKLTGNIWLAYGLGNIIITGLMLYVLWQIMKNLGFGMVTKLMIINLFLCPYMSNGFSITNDLGYFSCMHGLSPYQNVAVVAYLLMLWLVTLEKLERKTWIIFSVTILATFYICLCKGMGQLVWCGIPTVIFILFQVFYYNDIHKLISWKNLMLWGVLCAMFLGRIFGTIIGYNYIDSGMNWINASKFWNNLGNIILGFMAIVGGIPGLNVERGTFEFTGVVYIFGIIIFFVLLIAVIYSLARFIRLITVNKEFNTVLGFLLTVIIVNIMEYMFIDTSYGQDIFELRYLLDAVIAGFLLIGYFIETLDDDLLFKKFGILVLFFSVIGMDLWSDYFMAIVDNSSWKVNEVASVVSDTDAGLVVFWDSEKEFVKTERVLRVVDPDRVYKCISKGELLEDFGDYNYFDDSTQYKGSTILVVNDSNPSVPDGWLDKYTVIDTIGDMRICYSKENPIDILGNITNN